MKQSVIYSVDGLPKGEHTIRLETAGGAADCIVVDAFEVLGTAEEGVTEEAKLIVNQQWYYPNLAWENYTENQAILDCHISEDEKGLYTRESFAQYETAYERLRKRPGRQNNVKVKQITVSGTIKKLAQGKQAVLQADVFPANASDRRVKWRSSNPKAAAVNDSGVVTGKRKGTAVITAEAADGSGQIRTTLWRMPKA